MMHTLTLSEADWLKVGIALQYLIDTHPIHAADYVIDTRPSQAAEYLAVQSRFFEKLAESMLAVTQLQET